MTSTTIFLGRGSVVVENPTRRIKEGLRSFNHSRDGGSYDDLFFMSQSGDTMSTLPGYAGRIMDLCPEAKIRDNRVPMPPAMLSEAVKGVDPAWHGVITSAINAGGGVVSVPEMLGSDGVASAIARAFQRQDLLDRGTPLTVIASRDRESAKRTALLLRNRLPDRDVGIWSSGSHTDSEDIIVTTYGAMGELPLHLAGVFIGDDLTYGYFRDRAEGVSSIRNAARWGVVSTPSGGCSCIGLEVEGLFGPIVAQATYRQAVESGIGVPITVCWMNAPAPNEPLGSAPLKVLEETAITRNMEMMRTLSDIVRLSPNDLGCIVFTEFVETLKKVASNMPSGLAEAHVKMPAKLRRETLADIKQGVIKKAIVNKGCEHFTSGHLGVFVVATCGTGDVSGVPIPWRRLKNKGDRSFIVDFRHDWDVNNGRPGVLARNDEARMRRYRDLGFNQIAISEVNQLPFVNG